MRIIRLAYREEQSSLLNQERSEMMALLEIEHRGIIGFLRMDAEYEKRDADTELYCDVPGVTNDLIADTDWCWKLDEAVWKLTPESTTQTTEIGNIIIGLANHQLRSTT